VEAVGEVERERGRDDDPQDEIVVHDSLPKCPVRRS
jgi:hypothetical protein